MGLRRGVFRKRLKNKFGHIIKFVNISYNGYYHKKCDTTSIDYNYICTICNTNITMVIHPSINKRRKSKRHYYYIPTYISCNEVLIKNLLE